MPATTTDAEAQSGTEGTVLSIDADELSDATVGEAGDGAGEGGASFVSKITDPVAAFFTVAGLKSFGNALWPPLLGIVAFLGIWAALAPLVDTQLGQLPGPVQVMEAGQGLWEQHTALEAEKSQFYIDQDARNVELAAAGQPLQEFEFRSSKTSIVSQIWTSLRTVALGFLIGTVIAVPLGLLAGLSKTFQRAIDPLVQLFKPVSPLAWLPIVQLVIAASVTSNDPLLPISFIVSALVVTLNSLWPTLINTAVGAASVDKRAKVHGA